MTTTTTPTTGPASTGSVCAEAVVVVDGGIDLLLNTLRLAEADPVAARLSEPGQVREVLARIEKVQRRLSAARLRVVEHARRVQTPQRSGFTGPGPWLAHTTRTGAGQARQQAGLAEDLTQAPATRDALEEGRVSDEHARVITQAVNQLPGHLSDAERATIEQRLVRLAGEVDPRRLREQARRALAAVEPDPVVVDAHENQVVQGQEDRAAAATAFWVRENGDGTMTGHFTVPALAGMVLKKIIDAMTAPRRRTGSAPAQREIGQQDGAWKLTQLDWQHKRGLAFAELLEHLPTDHLPTKVAATVLVHVDYATLVDGLKVARTDVGEPLSAGTARRLACQAGIIPLVMGTDSVVLDQGEASRLHTHAQRMALSATYSECAAEGCDRPFAWCEMHHLTPWAKARRTNLADGVPLCGSHHQEIDRPGSRYTIRPGPNGTVIISFHRRT